MLEHPRAPPLLSFSRCFPADCMPFLKEAARNRGLDIVFSEMRFGIRDTASSANLTSEICMRELKRCLGESSGISYLLIAGDKYGFRPPPRTILKDEFEDLCSRLPEATALLVKSYYNLDSNALSSDGSEPEPEYVMINQSDRSGFWTYFEALQRGLRDAAHALWSREIVERELKRPDSMHPCVKYFVSVTHEEVRRGLFENNALEGTVYVVRRRFAGLERLQPAQDPVVKDFVDTKTSGAQSAIDKEAVEMCQRLMDETVPHFLRSTCAHELVPLKRFDFIPFLPARGLDPSDSAAPQHSQYMREFLDDICGVLLDSLDSAQDKLNNKPNHMFEECAQQLAFCQQRAARYFPTVSSSQVLSQYIQICVCVCMYVCMYVCVRIYVCVWV
jgi:hypothetical protein